MPFQQSRLGGGRYAWVALGGLIRLALNSMPSATEETLLYSRYFALSFQARKNARASVRIPETWGTTRTHPCNSPRTRLQARFTLGARASYEWRLIRPEHFDQWRQAELSGGISRNAVTRPRA